MWVESGSFGGDTLSDGSLSEIYEARVIIPDNEFEQLGLGDYERPFNLPACYRWCHSNLGTGGTRWSVTLQDDTVVLIYFAKTKEALAFLACWSAATAPARHFLLVS